MRLGQLAIAFALGGALAGAAVLSLRPLEQALAERPSVLVGGWVPPGRAELRGWLEQRRQRLAEREGYLQLPDGMEQVSFAELGLELDVDATLSAIEAADLPGSLFSRIHRHFRPDPAPVDVQLAWRFSPEPAQKTLESFRQRMHQDPVNARLDIENRRNVPDVPGRELDVPSSIAAIARGERDDNAVFAVAGIPVLPAVTADMLGHVDVSRVLGSYETDFSKKGGPRVINIRRAAKYLDGMVLGPGEVLSFNQAVGPRTESRGFTWAPVIVADELEPGLGGGVCQVASTLHAAALFGGMDIVQRRSHSRPSGYTPLGLDAVVVWGEVDLKIKNPYDTPVIVHAVLPTKTTVRVELLGREPPGKVEHTYAVRKIEDFFRRVIVKEELPAGEQKRKQKGIKGYDVLSTVKLTRPDGSVSFSHYASRYWPVPEIYWVSPGYDFATLPELPDGATHVEVAGEADPAGADSEAERERELRREDS